MRRNKVTRKCRTTVAKPRKAVRQSTRFSDICSVNDPVEVQFEAYKKYVKSKVNRRRVNGYVGITPDYFGCINSGGQWRLVCFDNRRGFFVGKGDHYGFTYQTILNSPALDKRLRNGKKPKTKDGIYYFGWSEKTKALNMFFREAKKIFVYNDKCRREAAALQEQIKANPQDIGARLALSDITG